MQRKLHGYFRSSAAYRVRIAINLKGIDVEHASVNLFPGIEEQHSEEYRQLNPQGRVPFYIEDDFKLGQSPAILEYLDECYPEPALLPGDPHQRAYVRQLSALIGCDVHPLNNSSVLKYIKTEFGADGEAVNKWYCHWIGEGFQALEEIMADSGATGLYCFGDKLSMTDIYLVPQIYNARRFGMAMEAFPTLTRIDRECMKLEAFRNAAPEAQSDAT